MNNKNLITEYKYFIENLDLALDIGLELRNSIKNTIKDSTNPHNLEWQLFYLEVFLDQIEKLIKDIGNTIYFKEKETKKENNIVILPLYPDEDMYVEEGENIKDFWGK